MSVYVFDGDIKFGWESFGRSFAIAGALALTAAAVGFELMHGRAAAQLEPVSQLFAWAMEWVGSGLFVLMAIAAWGSILITSRERGCVEITPEGVRRIFKPGKEEFLPLEEIEGFMGRPTGGVLLIDRLNRRDMTVPRSIEDYRDCIAELKAMGICAIPADPKRVWGRGKRTLFQNLRIFAMCILGAFYGDRVWPPLFHHVVGAAIMAFSLVILALEARKTGRVHWGACIFGSIVLAALLWWRW